MPVVDYFLNSLVKYLQKKQKERARRAKTKHQHKKSLRARKKFKPKTKLIKIGKRKKINRTKAVVRKPARKSAIKSPKAKKKKKSPVRKSQNKTRSKVKSKKAAKPKKGDYKASKEKSAPKEICLGEVTHYFSGISVIVLKMTRGKLYVGEQIHVHGRVTNFTQKVQSLQIESVDVKMARKGQLVGLKVVKKAKVGDKVFK